MNSWLRLNNLRFFVIPKIFLNSKIIQVSWSSTLSWKEAVKLPIKSNLWDLLLRILGHPFITLWRCIWEFPLHSIFCHHPDFWKVIFELTNCRSEFSCLLRLRVWLNAVLKQNQLMFLKFGQIWKIKSDEKLHMEVNFAIILDFRAISVLDIRWPPYEYRLVLEITPTLILHTPPKWP